MNQITLTVSGVSKEFNRRMIFRNVSFTISKGEALALTGKNGSGKSTLIKILSGVLTPSKGSVVFTVNGARIVPDDIKSAIGLVSPYLQLYDEFTGLENLLVLSSIRSNGSIRAGRAEALLDRFGLAARQHDLVRGYSSGMKQRLKYAFALLHAPGVLLLDEPTSNLDAEGIDVVREVVREQLKTGVLILATNDEDEAAWCSRRFQVA
ncbi:MAG: ABC transporter ATP-binding protein [Bacteroidota bacterium]